MPVPACPDTSKPKILCTDASDYCTGACLCHEQDTQGEMRSKEANEKLVDYLSHKQLHRQIGLQLKKRLLLCFYALQELEFVIRTDHKPLKYIMDSPVWNNNSTLDHKHPWLQL